MACMLQTLCAISCNDVQGGVAVECHTPPPPVDLFSNSQSCDTRCAQFGAQQRAALLFPVKVSTTHSSALPPQPQNSPFFSIHVKHMLQFYSFSTSLQEIAC